jgi:hypothetical protein
MKAPPRMKASKRKAKQAAPDRAGDKRLQHIADTVLAQERRDRRVLDAKPSEQLRRRVSRDSEREATMPPRNPNDDENDEPEIEEDDDEDRKDDDPAIIREPDEED